MQLELKARGRLSAGPGVVLTEHLRSGEALEIHIGGFVCAMYVHHLVQDETTNSSEIMALLDTKAAEPSASSGVAR